MSELNLSARLTGEWQLTRRVSGQAQMTGTAEFSPDELGLQYHETGQMTLADGPTLHFSRRYLYRIWAGGFDVLFDETPARLFQRVDLVIHGAQITGEGFHDCQPDSYVSAYTFELPTKFSIVHRVNGPRKSYVSETDFTRN